jgi:uncharacterized protein YjbI with pentapeptide repeats
MGLQKNDQTLKAVAVKSEGTLQKSKNQKPQKKNFNRRLNSFEKFTANRKSLLASIFTAIILILTIYVNLSEVKNLNSLLNILINNAGNIAIPVAVFIYFLEIGDRKEKKHYEAFQVIDSANGIETSYARFKAMQDLNNDNVSLRGIDVPNADLSGIELENVDLSSSDLQKVKFEKAILNGSNFHFSKLHEVDFSQCKLNNTDFTQATLINSKFFKTELYNAKMNTCILDGATINYCHFDGVSLCSSDLRRITANNSSLKNSHIQCAYFQESKLYKINFSNSDLSYSDFTGANLTGSNLTGASLQGANFESVDLELVEMKGAFYDDETKFPEGFDPYKNGLIKQNYPLMESMLNSPLPPASPDIP